MRPAAAKSNLNSKIKSQLPNQISGPNRISKPKSKPSDLQLPNRISTPKSNLSFQIESEPPTESQPSNRISTTNQISAPNQISKPKPKPNSVLLAKPKSNLCTSPPPPFPLLHLPLLHSPPTKCVCNIMRAGKAGGVGRAGRAGRAGRVGIVERDGRAWGAGKAGKRKEILCRLVPRSLAFFLE